MKNIALVLFSVALSLMGFEAALRIVPNNYFRLYQNMTPGHSTINYRVMAQGLYTMYAGESLRHTGGCFDNTSIRVNSQGFRGNEWRLEKTGGRAAVLGDSFAVALQTPDRMLAVNIIGDLLGVEVLNAGISGYSTLNQLQAYRTLIKPYRPDLVLLFFYVGNDLTGNSCRLDPGRGDCAVVKAGKVAAQDAPTAAESQATDQTGNVVGAVKDFLRPRLVFYQAMHDLKLIVLGLINQARGHVPIRWRQYLVSEPPEFREAWTITGSLISDLKTEVEAEGSRLAVIIVPEHFASRADWKNEVRYGAGSAVTDDFDPRYPTRRLLEITKGLKIPTLDLLPLFISYRDSFALPYPGFSFACDGHWNPLAHNLVAHDVAAFIAEYGLLPKGPLSLYALEEKRRIALATEPRKMLGLKVYEQIYNGGVYTGSDSEESAH